MDLAYLFGGVEVLMATQSIKFHETDIAILRAEAASQGRSIVEQAVHWQRIGRAIEKSGFFSYSRIRDALNARLDPDRLTGVEQAVFFEEFADAMLAPTSEQEAFFAALLQRKGLSVGLNEKDELVYSSSDIGANSDL